MPTEYRTSKMTCPRCGTVSSVPVFDMLDLSTASEVTQKMARNGQLFRFQCPECNKKENLNYSITSITADAKCMITVLDPHNKKEDYKRIVTTYKTLSVEADNEEKYRIVDTCQELSEKIRIFNDGLDDRIIEILKMFICEDIAEDRENLTQVRCMYNNLKDGNIIFSASYQKEKYTVELPTSSYLPVEQALEELPDKKLLKDYIVNQQWADKVIGIMMESE